MVRNHWCFLVSSSRLLPKNNKKKFLVLLYIYIYVYILLFLKCVYIYMYIYLVATVLLRKKVHL